MAMYFFTEPYDKDDFGNRLKQLGFKKEESAYSSYVWKNFRIHFTDFREGRIQIQGDGPSDINYNGEQSKYFPKLEELAKVLHPKKIIDDSCAAIFPQLTQR